MPEAPDLYDQDGILRESELARATPAPAYRVFLQRFDARFETRALEEQAARFFSTKIGLMAPKRERAAPPLVDHARFAVGVRSDAPADVRAVLLRAARPDDHALALAVEGERRATGLGGLARRCQYVAEIERPGPDDRAALLLAAIFASTHLGPILDVEGRDLFGVKTARGRLASGSAAS